MGDGAGGPISNEVNIVSDSAIRNRPSLRQATIAAFPSGSQG